MLQQNRIHLADILCLWSVQSVVISTEYDFVVCYLYRGHAK